MKLASPLILHTPSMRSGCKAVNVSEPVPPIDAPVHDDLSDVVLFFEIRDNLHNVGFR